MQFTNALQIVSIFFGGFAICRPWMFIMFLDSVFVVQDAVAWREKWPFLSCDSLYESKLVAAWSC
jgi:hypothetical protein